MGYRDERNVQVLGVLVHQALNIRRYGTRAFCHRLFQPSGSKPKNK